jgi:ELWxxDGT repeat protein
MSARSRRRLTLLIGLLLFLILGLPARAASPAFLVKDINLTALAESNPSSFTFVHGMLFFAADDGSHGQELWKSDGTDAGTRLFKDIVPGASDAFDFDLGDFGTYKSQLVVVHGMLFFSANGDGSGPELWRSDGTPSGTVRLRDINPGFASSLPGSLTNANGRLFFTAFAPTSGIELWSSDGTASGTLLVKDIAPGSGGTHDWTDAALSSLEPNGSPSSTEPSCAGAGGGRLGQPSMPAVRVTLTLRG